MRMQLPRTAALAVLVMLAGLGFLTISTAAISSAFIEQARRRRQAAAEDPAELRALLASQGTEIAALRREIQTLTAAVRTLQPADRENTPDGGS